jgi:hypothetical protein
MKAHAYFSLHRSTSSGEDPLSIFFHFHARRIGAQFDRFHVTLIAFTVTSGPISDAYCKNTSFQCSLNCMFLDKFSLAKFGTVLVVR